MLGTENPLPDGAYRLRGLQGLFPLTEMAPSGSSRPIRSSWADCPLPGS